ncbi:MAG: trehalose-6-phosphate synthase [Acidimicrobiales bacterium]|nr:trehalose-6-phosphate synthase [Acidimicrobiales bacterium]
MDDFHVIVAANRGLALDAKGDLSFGSGGLVSALMPAIQGRKLTWISAPPYSGDANFVPKDFDSHVADGITLDTVPMDFETYNGAYDRISNETLWFLHHNLFDATYRPTFDHSWYENFEAYRTYNQKFAQKIAEAASEKSLVLIQDYHLSLLPHYLSQLRPELKVSHFSHTPISEPSVWTMLPDEIAREIILGISKAKMGVGFHTTKWRDNFLDCSKAYGIDSPYAFSLPLGTNPEELDETRHHQDFKGYQDQFTSLCENRQLIVRVDRLEPSKNILRGFHAYDELLSANQELKERVVFLALINPSRSSLDIYRQYRENIEVLVSSINEKYGTPNWNPIELRIGDNRIQSMAALSLADVIFVNPVRDGLNLVAKEGPIINQRNGILALSREAGAFAELRDSSIEIHPMDVSQSAGALYKALTLDKDERTLLSRSAKARCSSYTARNWLDDLIEITAGRQSY